MRTLFELPKWQSKASPSKPVLWLYGLAFLLSSTGCPSSGVDFETHTEVRPDGDVTRTARYLATNLGREELEEFYKLPAGVTRVKQKVKKYDELKKKDYIDTVDVYTVTRETVRGNPIPSDFERKGRVLGRVVRNEIEISIRDYFFVEIFEFREAFRDVQGRKELLAFVERQYPKWVDHLAKGLEARLEGVTSTEASNAIKEVVDPWVNLYLSRVHIEELQELSAGSEGPPLVDALMGKLPPPSDHPVDPWRDAIEKGTQESFISLLVDEDIVEAWLNDFEFCLFSCTYGFKQTLSMPGDVLSTNATSSQDEVLTWEFQLASLLFQDYVVEARSRLIHRGRIGLAIPTVFLVVSSGAMLIRRKEKRKTKRRSRTRWGLSRSPFVKAEFL
jgi:hypothetical protein